LSPEAVETVLAEFRSWLRQVASAAATAGTDHEQFSPTSEPVDLYTLLGQFVALRHEVNLQTRAVRNQQEQNGETLEQLSQALHALRLAQHPGGERNEAGLEEEVRPLLKTLVDLHDVLALAGREIQRAADKLLPDLERLATSQAAAPPRSFWARLFGRRSAPSEEDGNRDDARQCRQAAERAQDVLGSLLTGYTMSMQRLERTLQQQELEPIACVGQPFDPERMEVVEVVADSSRAGQVVEEVRRGYLWHGRVFRYAQVKVAKS
jgi:molecular chaperone GrpE